MVLGAEKKQCVSGQRDLLARAIVLFSLKEGSLAAFPSLLKCPFLNLSAIFRPILCLRPRKECLALYINNAREDGKRRPCRTALLNAQKLLADSSCHQSPPRPLIDILGFLRKSILNYWNGSWGAESCKELKTCTGSHSRINSCEHVQFSSV